MLWRVYLKIFNSNERLKRRKLNRLLVNPRNQQSTLFDSLPVNATELKLRRYGEYICRFSTQNERVKGRKLNGLLVNRSAPVFVLRR